MMNMQHAAILELQYFRQSTAPHRLGVHRMAIAVRKLVPAGVRVSYTDAGLGGGLCFHVSARDGTIISLAFPLVSVEELATMWFAHPVESDGKTLIPDSYGGSAEARFENPSAAELVAFCETHGMV
jgi:hypothetical protein